MLNSVLVFIFAFHTFNFTHRIYIILGWGRVAQLMNLPSMHRPWVQLPALDYLVTTVVPLLSQPGASGAQGLPQLHRSLKPAPAV